MPSTVNGVGTRYAGKRDLTIRRGLCEKCGREVDLETYETRLWICVLFIPVIPLGRRQIVDYCPRCTTHRAAKVDQWQRGVHETLTEAARKARESPNDVEAHIELHRDLHWCGKKDEAAQMAESLPGMFPDSADVHVYLAAWCYETGRAEDERRHLERALEIDPECRPARRSLAVTLIDAGDMERARELAAFALEPGTDLEPHLCIVMAGGYMNTDRHDRAIELFERALDADPSLGQDAVVRKGVRECEKALGRSASILPAHAGRRRLAVGFAALAVIAVAALAGISVWKRGSQTLHVVNALPDAVEMQIDGGPSQEVRPGRTQVPIAEGDHTALITMPDGEKREVPVAVRNGLGQRLAGGNVFILNVAGAGTLLAYETVYTDAPQPSRPPEGQAYWGEEFLALRDIDYPFETPPETISVDSSSGEIRRWALESVRGSPLEVIQYALPEAPEETQLAFVEHHLRLDPDDDDLLTAYFSFATQTGRTGRCREFLAGELPTRPVRGRWHGFYQDCCMLEGDRQQVEEQYGQMLADEPDSAILTYLAARVASDAGECERLVDRALEADPDIAGAWAYKAMIAASRGNLETARDLAQAGLEVAENRFDISQLLFRIRFALGDYEALEGDLRREIAAGTDGELAARLRLLQLLGAMGREAEAETARDSLTQHVAEAGQGDPYRLEAASRADLCYWAGDWDGCRAIAAQLAEAPVFYPVRFWAPLAAGELDDAAACLEQHAGDEDAGYSLALAVAFGRAGEPEKAGAALQQGIQALDQGTYSEQRLARLLRAEGELDRDMLDAVIDSPESKAAALVLLAGKHPEQTADLLRLAKTLSGLDPYTQRGLAPFIAAARDKAATPEPSSVKPAG